MEQNRIKSMRVLIDNLRAEGQTSRADVVEELINEIVRLTGVLEKVKKGLEDIQQSAVFSQRDIVTALRTDIRDIPGFDVFFDIGGLG